MKINAYNWNSCITKVLERLEEKHELVEEPEDADVVVLWNEIEKAGWLNIVKRAQAKGIPVILYQQGVYGIDRVRPPFNEKIHSDVVLVWGPGDKDRLVKYGVPEEKIIVTGSPVVDRLIPKQKHDGKNVVFALEHWDWGDVPENHIVASELRKLTDVNLITKGLHTENYTENFENPLISARWSNDHLDIVADLLSRTDLVVAISESTFALLAEVLDIPVIIPDVWVPKARAGDYTFLDFEKNCSNAVTKCSLEDLIPTIKEHLKHPGIKREERKKNAIMCGGIEVDNPVDNYVSIIEKYGKRLR